MSYAMNTVVIGLIVNITTLLIEYFFIKPPTGEKKKIVISVIVVIFLVVPVVLLREVALKVAEIIGQSLSVVTRIDIYANSYAFLALLWGCGWVYWVRPWLYRRLQSLLQNETERGERRNE